MGDLLYVAIGRIAGADLRQVAFYYVRGDLVGAKHPIINGEVDRANGRSHGHPKGALNGRRQSLGLDDCPAGLGHRGADGGWACVMAQVEAYPIGKTAGVAGECYDDYRQAARPNVYQLPHALGESSAQVNHHHPRLEVGLGVSAGHGGNRAFVESQDAMDIRARMEFVEEQGFPRTRVVEDVFNP